MLLYIYFVKLLLFFPSRLLKAPMIYKRTLKAFILLDGFKFTSRERISSKGFRMPLYIHSRHKYC